MRLYNTLTRQLDELPQPPGPIRSAFRQYVIQRVKPFSGFENFQAVCLRLRHLLSPSFEC